MLYRLTVGLVVAIAVSGCGSHPAAPTADPILSCPADIQVESPEGVPIAVTYPAPSPAGGTPPYEVSCDPASGSTLGVGTYPVTCTVLDARGRGAACAFHARVVRPPRLTVTRFLAFGDSLTEGHWNETTLPTLVDEPNSYPTKLQTMLRAYFTAQSAEVLNDGRGGEFIGSASIGSPGATRRLPLSLDEYHPDVVLLMEGSNDLVLDYISSNDEQTAAVEGLGRMIDTAQARGVRVFVATIPPMNASGTKHLAPEIVASVPVFDARVRDLAAMKAVPLVDVYAAFDGHPELVSSDGLHLTILGYERIAQLFFDAINTNLGVPGALR